MPSGEVRADWFESESAAERRRRAATVLKRLRTSLDVPESFLHHENPFQLLVAVILSAQSTDANINKITPALFARYPTPEAMLASPPGALEEMIRSSGYYNSKARAIRGMSAVLMEKHEGQVPRTMEEMLALPGVARKTANVVLSQAYGVVEGIAVDTHVHRLAWRLGLSDHKDPAKVERDLMGLIARPRWSEVTNLLILHGRTTCVARAPRCTECVVSDLCPASRAPGRRPRVRR